MIPHYTLLWQLTFAWHSALVVVGWSVLVTIPWALVAVAEDVGHTMERAA